MRKTLLIAAIALISSIGMPAVAQSVSTPAAKEQPGCDRAICKKGERKDSKAGKCMMMDPAMLGNLNLTAEQKKAIEELNSSQMAANNAAREKMRNDKAADKKLRMEKKQRRKAEMQQQRRDYLNKLKSILTPEQYVSMLENAVVNGRPVGMKPGKDKGPKAPCSGDCRDRCLQAPSAK